MGEAEGLNIMIANISVSLRLTLYILHPNNLKIGIWKSLIKFISKSIKVLPKYKKSGPDWKSEQDFEIGEFEILPDLLHENPNYVLN